MLVSKFSAFCNPNFNSPAVRKVLFVFGLFSLEIVGGKREKERESGGDGDGDGAATAAVQGE